MRALLATLAVAGAIAAGCVATRAQVMADEGYSFAMMSASDVIRALRCAPPFGCKRQRSKPQCVNAPFSFSSGGLATPSHATPARARPSSNVCVNAASGSGHGIV